MFRPLVTYATVSFVILQVTEIIFTRLYLPEWTNTLIVVLVLIGFPITIFFAWVYDITPKGVRKTSPTSPESNNLSNPILDDKKSKKILLPITGFLTIVGFSFWVWYSLGDISTGAELDLQMGIKKSIAILNFENLTDNKEGDYFCFGISEGLRSI